MHKSLTWHLAEKEIFTNVNLRRLIGIFTFVVMVAAGAFIYIPLPFTPVPITLQTFFVLLCAAFLKPKDSVIALGAYLLLGVTGVPIFSGALGGLARFLGPTGGYIAGFIFSVFPVSFLLRQGWEQGNASFFRIVTAFFCGITTIYFFGGIWLAFTMHFSLKEVLSLGIIPFIAGDVVKLVFAALLYYKSNNRVKCLFRG